VAVISIVSSVPQETDHLLAEYYRLLPVMARRLMTTLPIHVEESDLVDAGKDGLLQALQRYDPQAPEFRPQVLKRIRGAMLDRINREHRYRSLTVLFDQSNHDGIFEIPEPVDPKPSSYAVVRQQQLVHTLDQAIQRLPYPERRVIQMDRAGMKQNQIARVLHISQPCVHQRRSRGIEWLRPSVIIAEAA
jgi:RNA polymerase sigma factor (sigma-70 family)